MATFETPLDLAKTQIALRSLRYGHFPAGLFDEYAWDVMLHLYVASLRGQIMNTDALISLTSKDLTVGERSLAYLESKALIQRHESVVALTTEALTAMNGYHQSACDATA